MNRNRCAIWIFGCLASISAWAEIGEIDFKTKLCFDNAVTTAAMLECSSQSHRLWDQALNIIYRDLLQEMTLSQAKSLRTSQRKWLAFRDDEFRAIDAVFDGLEGTIQLPIRSMRRTAIVSDRVRQLDSLRLSLVGRGSAQLAEATYEIDGGGAKIALVIPSHFINGRQALPAVWNTMNNVAIGNTSLAAYFTHREATDPLREGSTRGVGSYLTVRYPNENLKGPVSQKEFEILKVGIQSVVKNASLSEASIKINEYFRKTPSNADAENLLKQLTLEGLIHVSIDAEESDHFAYTQIATVRVGSEKNAFRLPMVQTSAVVLVRGRVLLMSMFDEVSVPAAIDVNRRRALTWVEATLRRNR